MVGISSFYNIIILSPFAMIFIYLTDSSVLNLTVLNGASVKLVSWSLTSLFSTNMAISETSE